MKNYLLTLLVSFGLAATTFSQNGTLLGLITDPNSEPVAYAAIALYSSDSVLLKGTTSDFEGAFEFVTKPGTYAIEISFLSFETKRISNIQVKANQTTNLGSIQLQESEVVLNEVEVVAEKSQMEMKLDKRVFNVGQDLTNIGGTAADVLDNVPSVAVDIDGNVSLRGSGNVRILINGKPSGLAGGNVAETLKLLQSDMIESVEVITNPSARYDAEGEVGIINIVLKKERKKGINGSLNATAGIPHNYSVGLNMNYRRKNINYFGALSLNYRQNPGYGINNQEFLTDTGTLAFQTLRNHTRGGTNAMLRFGFDYNFNKSNIISLSSMVNGGLGLNYSTITYNDYEFGSLTNIGQQVVRQDDERENQQNIEFNLTHTKTFGKKHELTSVVQFVKSNDLELSDILETNTSPAVNDLLQDVSNTENEQNILLSTDYVKPIGKEGKFETGARATLRTIENNFKVQQFDDETQQWLILGDFFNNFLYTENIYAGYMMYGNKKKKFSYQGGLRAEYSDIATELLLTNERNPRQYLNFFPSAHLGYELKKDHTLQVSYSRRLSRPSFRHLLPFYTFSDARNLYQGNPDLNPEYTHSFDLSYLSYFKKGSFLIGGYYRHRTGVINRIIVSDSVGTTRFIPVNLSTEDSYGIESNFMYRFKEWWTLNGNANLYQSFTQGEYNGEELSAETFAWTARITNKMSYLTYDWQLNVDYRSGYVNTQGRVKPMYSVNSGISKSMFNKKGTLTLSVRDLFNTRKRISETTLVDYTANSEFQWRARQFLLNFSYRINQPQRGKPNGKGGDRSGGGYSGGDDE